MSEIAKWIKKNETQNETLVFKNKPKIDDWERLQQQKQLQQNRTNDLIKNKEIKRKHMQHSKLQSA